MISTSRASTPDEARRGCRQRAMPGHPRGRGRPVDRLALIDAVGAVPGCQSQGSIESRPLKIHVKVVGSEDKPGVVVPAHHARVRCGDSTRFSR